MAALRISNTDEEARRRAERHPADRGIGVLNRYVTEMSDAILDHEGMIVTYTGDGIMPSSGRRSSSATMPTGVYAAARSMLNEKLSSFNPWLAEQGFEGFRMGIGLNTGPVVSGNFGPHRRLEYTAIGDSTNTASRLGSMTKELGVSLVVSESCRAEYGGRNVG